MALRYLPSHINESSETVDNLGGIPIAGAGRRVHPGDQFAPVASTRTLVLVLLAITMITLIVFVLRQRRAENPLYDLKIAARPTFWVAAVGGIIVFGSLMGAMFIGQQYHAGRIGYSTVQAGFAILPAGDLHDPGRAALGEDG